jgi:restriction system protein
VTSADAKTSVKKPLLDAKSISLEEWLRLLLTPEGERTHRFIDYEFPTDEHRRRYVDSIQSRTDKEIRTLLRNFLIPTGTIGHDSALLQYWAQSGRLLEQVESTEFGRRLIQGRPWEGITWILDLLPHWPRSAVQALDAFFLAHAQLLPDGRARGLSDAIVVIQARYLALVHPRDVLNNVQPREFEFLTAALYRKKGYNVRVTKATHDGGADVICTKIEHLTTEKVFVECKHHVQAVGVPTVRQLAGVVSEDGGTRGVIVTSAKFTKAAVAAARKTGRVVLLDYEGLSRELNEHVGPYWSDELTQIIASEQQLQSREAAGPASSITDV